MILRKGTYNLLTFSDIVGIIGIATNVVSIAFTCYSIWLTLKDRQQKSDRPRKA